MNILLSPIGVPATCSDTVPRGLWHCGESVPPLLATLQLHLMSDSKWRPVHLKGWANSKRKRDSSPTTFGTTALRPSLLIPVAMKNNVHNQRGDGPRLILLPLREKGQDWERQTSPGSGLVQEKGVLRLVLEENFLPLLSAGPFCRIHPCPLS